jgi:hypothetical protein
MTTAEEIVATEITIFADRVRHDVQTFTPGIRFEDAWPQRVTMTYAGQELAVVSFADLTQIEDGSGTRSGSGRRQNIDVR